MEAAASPSRYLTNPRRPLRLPSSPSLSVFSSQALISPSLPFPSLSFNGPSTKQPLHQTARKARSWSALRSSPLGRWLLEPAGDGDSRHIGSKVALPDAFEIVSNVVTVGRLPEKADMVIPIATVSGLHARLEKREGTLLVTDLDSTNGTYIDDKKLRPGAAATVSPGSCLTFGDTHLAMFRVSMVEAAEPTGKADESDIEVETGVPNDNVETAS